MNVRKIVLPVGAAIAAALAAAAPAAATYPDGDASCKATLRAANR